MKLLHKSKNMSQVKKILRSKRGETLMEGIVSVLILGILMAAVVSIIQFSIRTTGDAILASTEAQETVNRIINQDYELSEERTLTFELVFSFYNADGTALQTRPAIANQEVRLNTGSDEIVAFHPVP